MTVVRWILAQPSTSDTVPLPYNPNKMSTPTDTRAMQYATSSRTENVAMRGFESPQETATSWTWSGVILTKEHYDLLLDWAQRDEVLRVTDHLGRTFEIIIEKYEPVERLPTATRPWRADYTMTCLLLKEIA